MDQQSTSNLPPLPPEDTGEYQYAEESEEEDQTSQIQGFMKQMQDILSTQSKKKGKRREESPSSHTPGPRAKSTPATQPRPQTHQRREFYSTPTNPIPLQHQILRQERPVVKIKAEDYNLNFNEEEVEKFISKVERIVQIEGAREEDLANQMAFWTTDSKISHAVEAMPGYEEGNWDQLKKDLITKWGRVEPEIRYRKDLLIDLFNDTQDARGISTLSPYKRFIAEYETIITYLLRHRYIFLKKICFMNSCLNVSLQK
ncbi:hypothetical protein O181_035727 [Austropuccinia psidii MF-1]|uniref:Retrotransposon gag domain-containing protein n=1 Tax=Austropuccinia psidii MF-1 TaxID=1389203 RepID=A0A9Q3D5R8_9BASI|nr:hypothetical protein [Austropuccinia psidii MF-1]